MYSMYCMYCTTCTVYVELVSHRAPQPAPLKPDGQGCAMKGYNSFCANQAYPNSLLYRNTGFTLSA